LNVTSKPPIYTNSNNNQAEQQQIFSLENGHSDSKKSFGKPSLYLDKNNNNGFAINQETDANNLQDDPQLDFTTTTSLPVLERPKFKPTKATQLA
jgi:hypothetical protein